MGVRRDAVEVCALLGSDALKWALVADVLRRRGGGGFIVKGLSALRHGAKSLKKGGVKKWQRSDCHLPDFRFGQMGGSAYIEMMMTVG